MKAAVFRNGTDKEEEEEDEEESVCNVFDGGEMRGEKMETELMVDVVDDEVLPENALRSVNAIKARDAISHNLLHHGLAAQLVEKEGRGGRGGLGRGGGGRGGWGGGGRGRGWKEDEKITEMREKKR
ncbi:unnamed protein product [Eruca vesicaria subsp. sativa]|uniref:Uncharacterized protein n=1 Tax=Eruca vesicaria subsp. sativa TaxID=29727 RepID=A0ABC8IVK9_ERUVS|nr:unnamed protein product [Eruca vesicaria subsp. sativa]